MRKLQQKYRTAILQWISGRCGICGNEPAAKLDKRLHKFINVSYRCYFWSIDLYGSETWTLRKLERMYSESSEMCCWWRMEKIKWSEKVTNEQVLDRIEEKRALLNDILLR
jgi:hypothetical protein